MPLGGGRKSELLAIACEAIRRSHDLGLDSATAAMWALDALRDAEPSMSESTAFELVWSLFGGSNPVCRD